MVNIYIRGFCLFIIIIIKMKMENNNRIVNSNKTYNKNEGVAKLHPYFITGLVEAEGCFSVSIKKQGLEEMLV